MTAQLRNPAGRAILLVGLGAAAQTHLTVFEQLPGATVIAAVDPGPSTKPTFHDVVLPIYPSVAEAAAREDPSLVVIATPTPTHAVICDQIAEYFPKAEVLVEKPAADNLADARRLLDDSGDRRPVNVAYHMAFSPEVLWAAQIARDRAEQLGPPVAVHCSFTDPYQRDPQAVRSRLVNSWLDSGINLLSVISRFVIPIQRRSLRKVGAESWSAYEALVTCRTGHTDIDALILTSWYVTDPAKTTRIVYSSGAELIMDHTGVAGHLIADGHIADLFGSTGEVPRRESHYLAMYRWWLIKGSSLWPTDHSRRLHELLLRSANGVD